MPATDKVTILLADEDALRRDGLSAVLTGQESLSVIAKVADGEAALQEIRRQKPDVAIIELNLPKLHGIELIRRARAESFPTRIIIVAGTDDGEIVREVVRAGGDGYLLKNGPARHLLDAISYVRDGGQYFSPQLRRDGRDRHLLEEPARTPAEPIDDAADDDADSSDQEDRTARAVRTARPSRGRRPVRTAPFRDRIREEASGQNLEDRDYEIMTMMADGIRPILDRLDEIDNRVEQMETGITPVPEDPRGWLSTQLEDSLGVARHTGDMVASRSVSDLEAKLPAMIEQAVTARFHQMADKLQQEIEETHVRTLETFVKNIQVKLVQRVSALEHDMSKQAEAMNQLRQSSQRTEDNLSRLITGVDKLAQDLPRRLAAAQQISGPPPADSASPEPESRYDQPQLTSPKGTRRPSENRSIKMFWMAVGIAALVGLVLWIALPRLQRSDKADGAEIDKEIAKASNDALVEKPQHAPKLPGGGADTKTKMQAAQEAVDRKDYSVAEDLYKQVVEAEPKNVEALKALASVLYREDKIDESAAILDKIPK